MAFKNSKKQQLIHIINSGRHWNELMIECDFFGAPLPARCTAVLRYAAMSRILARNVGVNNHNNNNHKMKFC